MREIINNLTDEQFNDERLTWLVGKNEPYTVEQMVEFINTANVFKLEDNKKKVFIAENKGASLILMIDIQNGPPFIDTTIIFTQHGDSVCLKQSIKNKENHQFHSVGFISSEDVESIWLVFNVSLGEL